MAKIKISLVDKRIGRQLKAVRELRRISQTKLGKRLGISFQQVQKYEYGTNRISAATLFKAAQILKVDVGTFFWNVRPKAHVTITK